MLSKEEIKEGTELIVNYMDYWYEKPESLDFTYLFKKVNKGLDTERNITLCTIGNEKFHTSYDWIMEVIEKIEHMGFNFFSKKGLIKLSYNTFEYFNIEINDNNKKLALFKVVVEFIKYYNANLNVFKVKIIQNPPKEAWCFNKIGEEYEVVDFGSYYKLFEDIHKSSNARCISKSYAEKI